MCYTVWCTAVSVEHPKTRSAFEDPILIPTDGSDGVRKVRKVVRKVCKVASLTIRKPLREQALKLINVHSSPRYIFSH